MKTNELLKKADSDAEGIREESKKASRIAYEERMEQAKADGAKVLEKADADDRKAAEDLKKQASLKEREAVQAVIDAVLA